MREKRRKSGFDEVIPSPTRVHTRSPGLPYIGRRRLLPRWLGRLPSPCLSVVGAGSLPHATRSPPSPLDVRFDTLPSRGLQRRGGQYFTYFLRNVHNPTLPHYYAPSSCDAPCAALTATAWRHSEHGCNPHHPRQTSRTTNIQVLGLLIQSPASQFFVFVPSREAPNTASVSCLVNNGDDEAGSIGALL